MYLTLNTPDQSGVRRVRRLAAGPNGRSGCPCRRRHARCAESGKTREDTERLEGAPALQGPAHRKLVRVLEVATHR